MFDHLTGEVSWEGTTITVARLASQPSANLLSRHLTAVLTAPALIRPVFQPILSLATGTIVGYEGFSRFEIGPGGAPDVWFAEASRVGAGAELQAVAIRRILDVAALAGLPADAFLSLNVSPQYLPHPEVVAAFATTDPGRLVVELTEEEAVFDYPALRRAMAPYLRKGVRFAVDDAGAGFASMRHVIELQPAFVKLDAYLIRGMRSRQTVRAFLRAISGFTVEIGATLVAEGVETANDLAILRETGYPLLAQGFGISRPGSPWPNVSSAVTKAWRPSEETPPAPRPRRRATVRISEPPSLIPIEDGVNIGMTLGASLRRAGIENIETLRTLGAVDAWQKLRVVEADVATEWAVVALEGAIRGVRWGAVPSAERQRLVAAVTETSAG